MPAVSQSQRGLIFSKRGKYGSEGNTPKKWKWIWEEGWENKGKLPKRKKKKNMKKYENRVVSFSEMVNEEYDSRNSHTFQEKFKSYGDLMDWIGRLPKIERDWLSDLFKADYVSNEALITLNKRADVPEEDIQDVIDKVSAWFKNNPDRDDCYVGIFGHQAWKIEKDRIEEDIRAAARLATPYKKANESNVKKLKEENRKLRKEIEQRDCRHDWKDLEYHDDRRTWYKCRKCGETKSEWS